MTTPYSGAPHNHSGGLGSQPHLDSLGDDGFFTSLMDVEFTKYISLRMVKVIYIIGLITIVASTLYQIVEALSGTSLMFSFSLDSDSFDGGRAAFDNQETSWFERFLMAAFVLLIGIINVATLRVTLEIAQSVTRTARAWRRIHERQVRGMSF